MKKLLSITLASIMLITASITQGIYIEGETPDAGVADEPMPMMLNSEAPEIYENEAMPLTVTSETPELSCTMDYVPVCGKVKVQCVTTPCNPVYQTFGNACALNQNNLAEYVYGGECSTKKNIKAEYIKNNINDILDDDGDWEVTRVDFFDNNYTVVEYAGDDIMGVIHLSVMKKNGEIVVRDLNSFIKKATKKVMNKFLEKFDTNSKKDAALERIIYKIDEIFRTIDMKERESYFLSVIKDTIIEKLGL